MTDAEKFPVTEHDRRHNAGTSTAWANIRLLQPDIFLAEEYVVAAAASALVHKGSTARSVSDKPTDIQSPVQDLSPVYRTVLDSPSHNAPYVRVEHDITTEETSESRVATRGLIRFGTACEPSTATLDFHTNNLGLREYFVRQAPTRDKIAAAAPLEIFESDANQIIRDVVINAGWDPRDLEGITETEDLCSMLSTVSPAVTTTRKARYPIMAGDYGSAAIGIEEKIRQKAAARPAVNYDIALRGVLVYAEDARAVAVTSLSLLTRSRQPRMQARAQVKLSIPPEVSMSIVERNWIIDTALAHYHEPDAFIDVLHNQITKLP